MFARSSRVNFILSALFLLALGACGNAGGCGGCGGSLPLPAGGLPADQTVEGGAQIRVTPAGFTKLQSILPALLNEQFEAGFCVPRGEVGNCAGGLGTGACYCTDNNGPSCAAGCQVDVSLNRLTPTVRGNKLNIDISTSIGTNVGIQGQVLGIDFSCHLGVSSNDLRGDFDIAFGIDPGNGELRINLDRINSFHLGLDFSGCGPVSDVADFLASVIDSFLGQFIVRLLTPAINNLLQGFLPNPLGLAAMMDVNALVGGVSPGTDGFLEARIVPGGYINLVNNGMSLGVITGLNADEDPATRGPALDSEPHLCAPPLPAPNFGAPPANLPLTSRATYALGVAAEFNGAPDPQTDVAMGVSETMLDLAGHHLVTSGAMCLGIGTSSVDQLNLGTIGILVPSLAELGSERGNDPLLLVTRPQRALDFTIGDNTVDSPAITIGVQNLEIDFYAFLYERYVRAFTLDVTLDVGINLDFEQAPGQPAQILPTLVGISSNAITLKVLNSQFLQESPQKLEAVLPTVFDLITPLLGNLPGFNVPTFAGFSLDNLSIQHVTTAQDDFLALYASLGASQLMRNLGATSPLMASAVGKLDASRRPAAARSTGRAELRRTTTPAPAAVRAALGNEPGAMPEVAFAVDRVDAAGRELEWSYNLNGGMWRPYRAAAGDELIIRDRAFAWQGTYDIGLKSRVVGDYRTTSEIQRTEVVIDSVGPRVFGDKALWAGDRFSVPLLDVVSGHQVQYAFGRPGADRPSTAWTAGDRATIDRVALNALLAGGEIAVFAKDPLDNETIALIAPFHGQPGEAGCDCATGSTPGAGSLVLVGLVGFVLVRRRRARATATAAAPRRLRGHLVRWLGLSALLSIVPGCSCGDPAAKTCETVADCGADYCADGEIPFCIDNTCVCSDDIILGRIGAYADVAVGADGSAWVSAYAQTYGDLVVARVDPGRVPDEAWEFVDGVPDGPVLIEGSEYRHGIAEKGVDVGMYTSIAVTANGAPMVSYFDRGTPGAPAAALKLAYKQGDTWVTHVVDAGTGTLDAASGELVGMYTSLSLRSDDGRPGIAYLAHVADANGARAEVRYAAAQVPFPTSAADWQTWIVDSAPLPAADPTNPNIYPLPEGLGLFVDATRLANQAPVVVYYDRGNGDLKLAKFNPAAGQFDDPVVLDGSGNVDAGWSPSVAVAPDDTIHVAYVGATGDDLRYVTSDAGAQPQVVDDGYRIVGQTVDGLPKPEFHFVGEDASLVLANAGTLPMVAYQDATTQELLLATQKQDGTWDRVSVAGATDPWTGGYGFFTAAAVTTSEIVITSWVINQPNETLGGGENWVEVFRRPTVIQ